MNLSDFEKTNYSGLYISKVEHPTFGKKYIARFQYDKKRYVKVLGYTKKDNLSKKAALNLMQKFKDSIVVEKKEKEKKVDNSEQINDEKNEILLEENKRLKALLGNFKDIDPQVLQDGIQKIYDLEELKKYQIELIKLQNYLENENK